MPFRWIRFRGIAGGTPPITGGRKPPPLGKETVDDGDPPIDGRHTPTDTLLGAYFHNSPFLGVWVR